MNTEEKRIYVVVAATVQIGDYVTVEQPLGRQCAQVAHAVSKLRFEGDKFFFANEGPKPAYFQPITTIVKACRDSAELDHIAALLYQKKLHPVAFYDTNEEAYGRDITVATAVAVLMTKTETYLTIDYLPMWGAE